MIESVVHAIAAALCSVLPFECLEPVFMQRALLGVLLIAPLAAMTGIHVVNSRMAFFSDAIGHSAFAGVALGLIFALSPAWTMPLLALAVGVSIMFMKRRSRLSSDTVIGVVFSAVVAFGLAVVSQNRAVMKNAQLFLFGDILTIGPDELAILFGLLLAAVGFQIFAYNRLLSLAVNPQLASVHRIRVAVYQYGFTLLLSLVVIYSVRAVGVLLVTALLIVPAATARNFANNARQMFWYALFFGFFSGVSGLLISAQEWADSPSGAAIVLCSCAMFAVSFLYAAFRTGKTIDSDK